MEPHILELSDKNRPGASNLLLRWGKVGTIKLKVSRIKKIVAREAYCYLYIDGKKYIVNTSLNTLVKLINPKLFLRVNQYNVVNIRYYLALYPD